MSLKIVRDTLNTHMRAYSSTLDIAWENVAFTPKSNTTHIRVNFIPVQSIATARFKSAMIREQGYYQIDVYSPLDQGTSPNDVLVNGLRTHFKRGTSLTGEGGQKIYVPETPAIVQSRREGAFYRNTITVDWIAHFSQP